MLNYQSFSNWTGTSLGSVQTNNGSIGASAVNKAFSSLMYKLLAAIFA